jgi:hypothetical protein
LTLLGLALIEYHKIGAKYFIVPTIRGWLRANEIWRTAHPMLQKPVNDAVSLYREHEDELEAALMEVFVEHPGGLTYAEISRAISELHPELDTVPFLRKLMEMTVDEKVVAAKGDGDTRYQLAIDDWVIEARRIEETA